MEEGKLLTPFSHLIDWDITKIQTLAIPYELEYDPVKPLVVLGDSNI